MLPDPKGRLRGSERAYGASKNYTRRPMNSRALPPFLSPLHKVFLIPRRFCCRAYVDTRVPSPFGLGGVPSGRNKVRDEDSKPPSPFLLLPPPTFLVGWVCIYVAYICDCEGGRGWLALQDISFTHCT